MHPNKIQQLNTTSKPSLSPIAIKATPRGTAPTSSTPVEIIPENNSQLPNQEQPTTEPQQHSIQKEHEPNEEHDVPTGTRGKSSISDIKPRNLYEEEFYE